MKIIELDSVDSTNEYCKRIGKGNIIVTAKRQTSGNGTKGRSFVSDEGGLYLTVMKNYSNFPAKDAFKIMVNGCVAVCRTVESFGLTPVIRWANDVLVGGKKISGTLIENSFSGSFITRSIVGIGLNVNNTLPENLTQIATTMKKELTDTVDISRVKRELIKNLGKEYNISEYKSYINWFGKDITLKTDSGEFTARAADIDIDGGLLCVLGGTVRKISAAEVSLRL